MNKPPVTTRSIINDALGEWASNRSASHLSNDLNFGPVRADAVQHIMLALVTSAEAEAERQDAAA